MKFRSVFKFMVLILAILFANLVTIWADNYMLSYRRQYAPHIFTWIGMGVVLVIYYPLLKYFDKWSTLLSDKFLKAGKKLSGRKLGTFITFIVGLFILFFFYGKEWFHTNVFSSMFQAIKHRFF
ncbi:MAG TPA: hypothetical protein VJY41_10215 [Prolixibacteraceae bacterium]|nr:hypothetical protein [Prolixibacteraceae bacterium]